MAEKIGPIFNRILIKKLDQALDNGSINKKDYNELKKKYFGKPKLIQMDLFDPKKKKQGGLMEATRRLKAQGLRKGGKAKKAKRQDPLQRSPFSRKGKGDTKSNKTLTPQEKKDLLDKIRKSQGKLTNPYLKFNNLGQPYMEAKKGGSAKKFPDLSGDGKVTMKDVLMGRGVIKKPKKKKDGGKITNADRSRASVFLKARELKPGGRLTVDDIKRAKARQKQSMTLKSGSLQGAKDAPEERARERQAKTRKAILGARGLIKGLGKGLVGPVAAIGKAGQKAGRLAKRGYGIAKK